MKTKPTKRLLCIVLAVMILSCGMTALASDEISPYWASTSRITASLSISSGGVASCNGSIRFSDSNATANIIMRLQRYENSSWTTVQTWSATSASSLSKSRSVTSGYNYRVVFSATVYSSGVYVESPSATSYTVYYGP